MAEIVVAGKRLAYLRGEQLHTEGAASLVFIHGAGAGALFWTEQLKEIGRHIAAYAIDLPGHGGSEGPGEKSVEAYREVVSGFIRARGLGRVILAGHSMGGGVALDFALTYPEKLLGLIVIGSGAKLGVSPMILDTIKEHFSEMAPLMKQFAYSPDTPEARRESGLSLMFQAGQEEVYNDFLACRAFDIRGRLTSIDVPALFIVGRDDLLTPPRYSEYLAKEIRGAQMAKIAHGGHMVTYEHPSEVNGLILKFLKTSMQA